MRGDFLNELEETHSREGSGQARVMEESKWAMTYALFPQQLQGVRRWHEGPPDTLRSSSCTLGLGICVDSTPGNCLVGRWTGRL